jgi:hypothetical protein
VGSRLAARAVGFGHLNDGAVAPGGRLSDA